MSRPFLAVLRIDVILLTLSAGIAGAAARGYPPPPAIPAPPAEIVPAPPPGLWV